VKLVDSQRPAPTDLPTEMRADLVGTVLTIRLLLNADKSRLAGEVALQETADVSQSVVKVDPEIMSGAPCFAGTRVPIQNLIDYLESGDSIEEFLDGFPSVSREQVIAFLEEAKNLVLAAAVE
jgi:uncharacterized protein (DUF433 family)